MRPITAADLMNSEVLTVPEDMPVRELAAFLVDNEITGAPVVDEGGRPVGVVSLVDLAEVASEDAGFGCPRPHFLASGEDAAEDDDRDLLDLDLGDAAEDLRAGDIMTEELYWVEEDATVSQVALAMLRDHLHRLLVLRDGEVLGIISTSDLLGLLVDVE